MPWVRGGLGPGHKLAKCRKPSSHVGRKNSMCSFYYALGPFTRRHFACTVGAGARAKSVPHSAIYYTFVQIKKVYMKIQTRKNALRTVCKSYEKLV